MNDMITPTGDAAPQPAVPMSKEVADYAARQPLAGDQLVAGPQLVPPSAEGVAHLAAQNTLADTAADVRDDEVMGHAVRAAEDQFGALVKRTGSTPLAEEGGSTGDSVSVANQPIQPAGSGSMALEVPANSGSTDTSEPTAGSAAGPKVLTSA